MRHKLNNLNKDELTADCSICGPVPVRKKTNGDNIQYRCRIKMREEYRLGNRVWKTRGVDYATEFSRLWKEQDGICAVCSDPLDLGPNRTHLDHCHETGKLRGLLCFGCNVGLGHFKDNLETLASAIKYLSR